MVAGLGLGGGRWGPFVELELGFGGWRVEGWCLVLGAWCLMGSMEAVEVVEWVGGRRCG